MTQQQAIGIPFSLRDVTRSMILDGMLGTAIKDPATWHVLILDPVTVKTVSSIMRVSDLLADHNIALLEDLNKNREPMQGTVGIYFISPTEASVRRLIFDFGSQPMHSVAHVFFSSPAPPALIAEIRSVPNLVARLRSLKEMSMEYTVFDSCTFCTGQERALQLLYGEGPEAEGPAGASLQMQTAATRLLSLLVSLKEYPSIRYRAAAAEQGASALQPQTLIAQRIAVQVHDRAMELQKAGSLPESESCDLLVVDRAFDLIAPIIHEWTYGAIASDILELQNNVFRYQADTQAGKKEAREHVVGDSDALWTAMRGKHLAAACLHISAQMDDFRAKNQAATYFNNAAGTAMPLDSRSMKSLTASLPQYRDVLSKLAVHVEMASRVNAAVNTLKLAEISALEQSVVYGDASSKELITFLTTGPGAQAAPADKLRLLLCFGCTHPDKMDHSKQLQWQKLAKQSTADMEALRNLELLGVPINKKSAGTGLWFGSERKRTFRKEKEAGEGEEQWALSRFVPMLQDILEDLHAGKLSEHEFPYLIHPDKAGKKASSPTKVSVRQNHSTLGWALSSAKKAGAKPTQEDHAAGLPKRAKRLIVFICGPVTHSEIRVIHALSAKLGRDVVLGGTSVCTPTSYIQSLRELSLVPTEIRGR